jgi:hypothetical protein
MPSMYVEYPLQNGFVHHWLVAGPQATPIDRNRFPSTEYQGSDFKHQIFQRHYTTKSSITATPVERGPVDAGLFTIGKYTGAWSYYRCPEDHRVDHSGYYPSCHYLRSWAYVEAVSDRQQTVQVALTTYGPADVWIAGKHLYRLDHNEHNKEESDTHTFPLQLNRGVTPILIRYENIGVRHTAHAIALRFCHSPGKAHVDSGQKPVPAEGVHVRFRTLMPDVERRNTFEQLSAAAYMDRDIYEGETPIMLCWPEEPRAKCFAHVRFQTTDNRIYAEGDSAGGSGDSLQLGHAVQLPAGAFQTVLMPTPNEVYRQHMRIFQTIPLWSMGRQRYKATPSVDLAERRNEALLAAAYIEDSLFAQIARMAWGAWADVDSKVLLTAIERVRRHEDRSNLLLLGLLGMLYRWSNHPHFPQEIRQPLEACILGYHYWLDEADHNVMDCTMTDFTGMDFIGGSNPILFHACELLAGQLFSERIFADQQSGDWHRARGERLAKNWMAAFGAHGSAEWNSPESMEQEVATFVHLCDLAEAEQVYEMAAVSLDKLLFSLALNSFRGILGVAGRGICASFAKSGLLQPTTPICHLMWGMGIFNHHIAGVVSLACSTNYQMPTIIETIALDAPAELWSREQHALPHEQPANIVLYKTPDYVMSSLQDYLPGQPGQQERVWQVTLGAEPVVFATHPGSSSESDSRYPGYWSGNARLPRVAQWKDVLVSIHQLGEDDLLGLTHAYFPTVTFDDYLLRDGWAFARCGSGYLALTNSQGFIMPMQGRYAKRELRVQGTSQIWLVQMGRAALDGDFAEFQAKVLALPIRYADRAVHCTTLRGDTLHFSWEGSLLVNDEVQPLKDFKHYENPYTTTDLPCRQMEIQSGEDGLRLDFTSPDFANSAH